MEEKGKVAATGNWLACFEMVSQTNSKVEKQQKFYYTKTEKDSKQLKEISAEEYRQIETIQREEDEQAMEIKSKEQAVAGELKEFNLTKRQRRSVMMLTGGDQQILGSDSFATAADQQMLSGAGGKQSAARNAWPAFVPDEMAQRFLNENNQVEKVTNAELEPIQEEHRPIQTQDQSASEAARDQHDSHRVHQYNSPQDESCKVQKDDGRLAWQYEKSETKNAAPRNANNDARQQHCSNDFWADEVEEVRCGQGGEGVGRKQSADLFQRTPKDMQPHDDENTGQELGRNHSEMISVGSAGYPKSTTVARRDVRSRPIKQMKSATGRSQQNSGGVPPKPRQKNKSKPRIANVYGGAQTETSDTSFLDLTQNSVSQTCQSQAFDQHNAKVNKQKRALLDQHMSNMRQLDQMPATKSQLFNQTAAAASMHGKQLPVRLEPLYKDGVVRNKQAQALHKHLAMQHASLKEQQKLAIQRRTFGDFIPHENNSFAGDGLSRQQDSSEESFFGNHRTKSVNTSRSRQILDRSTAAAAALDGDHLQNLDQILSKEEQTTGKRVFKRGTDLRHGLIDVQGVLDVIKEQQSNISDISQMPSTRSKSSNLTAPLRTTTGSSKAADKQAWKMALKAMAKNPQLLMESVPSVWD